MPICRSVAAASPASGAPDRERPRRRGTGLRRAATLLLLALTLFLAAPLAGQVEEAADRGRTWLLTRQNLDGSFGSSPGLAPRDSGTAVLGLLTGGAPGPEIDRSLVYLSGAPERAAELRARRALALGGAGRSVAGLLDSLGEFENGGGYGAFGSYESNLLDTALAVQALALEEEARLLAIVPLLDYLQLHQNPDGGWGYVAGDLSRTYFTAEAALALSGLERLAVAPEVLAAAGSYLRSRQLPDGSFGSPLETALAYRALLALGTDVSTLPASPVGHLLAVQAADGSWGGDVFTTGQVLVALGGEEPNLTVAEVSATPEDLLPGEAVTVTATLRNLGPTAAPASWLEVRAGTPEGEARGEAEVPELASGASHEVQVVVATAGDAGELVLHAVADARDEIAEGDEADNSRAARVTLRTEPDLALYGSDLTVSPSRPEPGTSFRLLISVRNQGETEVDSFGYRVTALVAGVPTEPLAEGTAGPAPPGAGGLVEVPLTLPEGEHLLRVEVDPDDAVPEAREENNSAEIAFFVVDDDLPDLAIAEPDLTATPARPAVGESVTASATVRNAGAREATARVELWDGEPGAGTLVASQTVTVPPAGSETITAAFTAGAGTVAVVAVVDPAGEVEELSEANNRARRFLVDRPDLAIGIDNLDLSPLDPLEGETVHGAVTVRNAGTLTATGVEVTVHQSDPEAGAPTVFTGTVPELAPGANRTLTFSWTAEGGLHALTVVVDPADALAELSETNNRAAREIAVPRATGANLASTAIDPAALDHSALTLAASGTVVVTVGNDGDADAGAFLVRLVEDRDGDARPSAADRELAVESVPAGVPAGGATPVSLSVDTTFSFYRPLLLVEVDPTDLVPESREDDNRRPLFGACEEEPPLPSLEAVEEWYLPGLEVETSPAVVQLTDDDGDGRIDSRDVPDVVFHTEDAGGRAVTARSGLDGSEIWTLRSTPADPIEGRLAHLAAADLDGEGIAEVIAIRGGGRLVAIHHTGRILWVSEPVESAGGYNWGGAPAVGDLDGDGVPEIAVGRSVLSNTGRLLAQGTANVGRNYNYYGPFGAPYLIDAPLSVIADVDLDGRNELVAGDTLYRLEGGTLQVVWDRSVPDKLMVDGYTAVGNLDADPQAEIVYVSSNKVMVLNHDGTVLRDWRYVQPLLPLGNRTFWAGPPSLGDLDGDGSTDVLVAASHELVAMRSNLTTLWRVATTDVSEMTVAVPFDLDGDGADEVLFLDHTTFRILDGATGATLHSRPNTSKTLAEGPVVADMDGDGRAEVLVPSNRSFGGDSSTQGLHVLGHPSWRGTGPIWNQHSHRGTNVQADGTVPSRESAAWPAGAGFRSNLELPAPERLLPNLTVGLPRVGRAGADGVPVVVRVGNGGLATVPPGARVALYADDPATGAAPVGEGVTALALRPGDFEEVSLLWQVAGAAGEPAWAAVDPDDNHAECAEDDNVLAFTVAESVLPDLAIPAGGVTVSGPLAAGQRVPVSIRVENAGAAEAAGFTVRLYDGDPALGRTAGEVTVDSLPPGAGTTLEIPWETLGVLPGRHALHALADADDLLLETTEENNRGLLEVDLAAPALPDLALENLTLDPAAATSGETVRLAARVLNRGSPLASGFAVAFRVNGAEVGRVEVPEALSTGEARTVELPWSTAGRQGLLAVEAVADPAGTLAEITEANNRATVELPVAGATLSLAVATDRLSYAPGDAVAVTVTAANAAAAPREVELRVRITDAAGVEVAVLASQAVTLAPGSTPFDLAWESGAALPGAYAVVAELIAESGAVARGETLLSLARQVAVTADLFADRDLYPPGGAAVLRARVANASGSTLLSGLSARLAVLSPVGAEVYGTDRPISVLFPGSEQRLEAVWDVGAASPGAYTATLSVRDDAGFLRAFASTPLAVEDTSDTGAGLAGELAVAPGVVGAGAPLLTDFRVENRGNADLPALTLRVDLLHLAPGAAGTPAASLEVPRPLPRGAAVEESFAFDTAALAAGDYLAALVAVLPGADVTLDRAAVTVAAGISVADAAVAEGDAGSAILRFAVRLSEPLPDALTVDFATADGTAEAGTDYTATTGTLTLAAGETEAVAEVPVAGDLDPEPDEILLLSLSDPSGALPGRVQALGSIRDEEGCASPSLLANGAAEAGSFADPVPGWDEAGAAGWRLRFAAPTPLEGRAAFAAPMAPASAELIQTVGLEPFAARIDAGGQPFLFEGFVRSADEAAPDAAEVVVDYLDGDGAVLSSFASGEIVSPVVWQPVADLRTPPAGTRAVRVRLVATRAAGGATLEAYFDRLALRSVGTPTLAVLDAEVLEGDAGSTVLGLPVVLSCALTTPVRVDFATVDGTATAGTDYQATSGTLTLAAGETGAIVEIPVQGDGLDEADENFSVTISTPDEPVLLRPAAAGTIRDDDGPVLLSIADLDVLEGHDGVAEALVTVSLSTVSGKTVTASWATAGGTAAAGADYESASGIVTLPAGETSAVLAVPILGDRVNEPAETFTIALAALQEAALGDGEAIVTILDDDTVEIAATDARVVEGDAGEALARFAVTLSVPSVSEVTVAYATSDGPSGSGALAGTDYAAASGTLTFAPGETAAEVAVPVLGDTLVEPVETFLLTLSAPAGGHPTATLADPEAVASIVDDDGILLSVADLTLREGAGAEAVFRVILNKPTTVDVSAAFETRDGTATAGADYQATAGTVTIPAGAVLAEVRVPLVDNTRAEPPQTFALDLSNPSGEAILLDPEAEATVLDDDGWALNGTADDVGVPGCIVLTVPLNNQRGTAWWKEPLDLTESFDKTFRIYLGDKDANGGYGLYFALQTAGLTALGGNGHGGGFSGIRPSVGVEVDTLTSSSVLQGVDHLSMGLNGSEHTAHEPVALPVSNVEDGEEHELRVIWNAATKTFDVHFDGIENLVHTRDVVATVFGGDSQVFWGLTGSTGGVNNLQYACDTSRCVEGGPGPALSVGHTAVTEGDAGAAQLHFPVTLSCPSDEPVTVSFATADGPGGTGATAGEDYLPLSGTLTFQPGETGKDVVVEVVGDTVGEPDEVLYLVLSDPVGAGLARDRDEGVIRTDDFPLSILDVRVVEGDRSGHTAAVPVELGAPAPFTIQVSYATAAGTATAGSDYQNVSGRLTFGAGQTVQEINVPLLGDGLAEGDEHFFVDLTNPSGATLGRARATVTLADDDDCPGDNLLINPSADDPLVAGEIPGWTEVTGFAWTQRTASPSPYDGGAYFFPGSATQAELRQDVDVSSYADRIDAGLQAFELFGAVRSYDHNAPDGARVVAEYRDAAGAILAAFDSGEITSRSAWRAVGEIRTAPPGTRTLRVRLLAEYHAGTANDGYFDGLVVRPVGTSSLVVEDTAVAEGETGETLLVFPVRLTCSSPLPVAVDYVTADGTATAGSDYRATFGTLTFAPGELVREVSVPVLGDTTFEPSETLSLHLAAPVGAGIARRQAEGTILQDEVFASVADTSVAEGTGGSPAEALFRVTLSGPSPLPVRIAYRTVDGSAAAPADYEAASGTLTLEPGEVEATLAIAVAADAEPEAEETFSLLLEAPVNVALDAAQAACTIVDDDLSIEIADAVVVEGSSGSVTAVFPVTLSRAALQVVRVSFATEDALAAAGEDYLATSGTITFAPGETAAAVEVQVLGDELFEPSETFLVRLSNPVNAGLLTDEALGTIADDDDCAGPNLLRNPGGELGLVAGKVRHWEESAGTWGVRTTGVPAPFEGGAYLAPVTTVAAELRQDVDVSSYAGFIDAGIQRFAFEGVVRAQNETEPDTARIVVEYLDGDGATLLDRFDSGEIASSHAWRQAADLRVAPEGTRTIRVRLLGRRTGSTGSTDAFFDGLALRSLGTPVLQVEPVSTLEGDTGTTSLEIPVALTCAAAQPITVDYATGGGGALAGTDYLPAAGELRFEPGEVVRTVPLSVLGDSAVELEESIFLSLSNPVGGVLVEPGGDATILDDDNTGRTTREIRTFWLGDLRIFAWADDTEVTLIDIDTGQPLSMTTGRISSTNFTTNPFVLSEAGDSFEGIGSNLRVRIVTSDAKGGGQLKPVTVWTGGLASSSRHPGAPIGSGDAWASYLPAFSLRERANGRELGNQFLGFTSRELTLFVRPGAEPTVVQIEDLVTNADPDGDDTRTLGPADAVYADSEIEIYYVDGFEDDTVRLSANTELSALAGLNTRNLPDWTISPPSYATGDDGIELGTEFYTFVHRSLTVFPIQDDTTVTVTDLSDGDDSLTFTLANGDTLGDYDLFTPILSTRDGGSIRPRASDPAVNLLSTGDPFDNDYVKVTSDKPVLVYVGPPGSDVNEFADVAFSVPTGSETRIIYCYAQNGGGQDDLQIFGFTDDTVVTITSLTATSNFNGGRFHDFQIGPGIGGSSGWRRGRPGSDVWWGSSVWSGELLRIESNKPVVVINGDYDSPHFGAFIPFLVDSLDLPPLANAGSDRAVTAGETVAFDGTGSFDQDDLPGPLAPRWEWDLDLAFDGDGDGHPGNDVDAVGPTPEHPYYLSGVYSARLVFFDDEGESDDDVVQVTVAPHPLTLTKTAERSPVQPGDAFTYTLVLRNAAAGPVTDVVVTDGLTEHLALAGEVTTTAGTVAGLDPVRVEIPELLPGTTVTITLPVQVARPLAPEVLEVPNQATALAAGLPPYPSDDPATPEPLDPTVVAVEHPPDTGEPALTATKTDTLAVDADGDGLPSPGDEIGYEIVVTNAGTGPATGIVLRDLPPLHAPLVAGSLTATAGVVVTEDPVEVDLGTLEAGATATVSFRVAVELPIPAGVDRISNQGTVTSAELPAVLTDDPELGGDADPTVTMLTAAPELVAEKTAGLAADLDGDGSVSPGDEVEYVLTVRNVGNTAATDVVILDPIPEHTALVAGSVAAPEDATVEEGDPVRVALGELAGGATAEVRLRVRIENPIAPGVREVVNQALVTSVELPEVVSDDPEVDGPADPTVTPVNAAPELRVEKGDTLFEDSSEDGAASPGDVLLYRITVTNSGNTAATAVILTDPVPEHATLEPGTIQASHGAVVLEDPVTVELGEVAPGAEAVVTFRVRIAEPFPLDLLAVINQAEVASAELEPVPSDDPETAEEGDPTTTEVFVTPEVTVDDVTVEETAGTAVFTLSLSRPGSRPVQVPWATADGPGSASASPATAGLDYLPAAGTVTLAPGETTATVTIQILDDLLDELDETFTLTLGEPAGAVLLDASALGTILDDDPPPFVSVGDAEVREGDPGDGTIELVFPVTLSAPSGLGIAVDFTTAEALSGRPAAPGTDFVATAGTLALPPGTTTASVVVEVVPDRVDEFDEALRLLLSNPLAVLLGDAEGVGTILDDDEARISIGDVTVQEGDTETADAIFPLRLTVPADREVTVRYATAPGSAVESEDYLPVTGIVALPAGTTEAAVAVPVVGDLVLEPLEETFTVELSEPTETTLEDAVGVGTIVDDEECLGPNLLLNPGAEARPAGGDALGELPAWLEVEGTTWQRRFDDPAPAEGAAYFFAGEADLGELVQEVSVQAYEVRIEGGAPGEPAQPFRFTGRVRTYQESPPDTARVVVEYRDRTHGVVLDAFDSGEISSPDAWQEVSDIRPAPVGTGWIRIRLIATRFAGQTNDGYFDALALRSLRAPTLTVSDATVNEGNAGQAPAGFTVALSCPYHREVPVSYATADGPPETGAVAGSDYLATAGSLTLPAGETAATVAVPVLGDTVHERHETFHLDVSLDLPGAAPRPDVVLLDPRGEGLIVNDDFCARSHGFWKTHEELWPTDWLEIGGVEYGAAELAGFLSAKGGDQTLHLALQLVATKLNLLVGSDPAIVPVVEDADAFLAAFPPGSNPKGADRQAAETLKNALDAYNNSPCQETPVIPEGSPE